MGHKLRLYLPNVVYEITARTVQGRFLLRPGAMSRELILGVLGRGLAFYPSVQMHAFGYLSNHAHLLISAEEPEQIPAFLCYVNGNVALEMKRLHDWSGALWDGDCNVTPITDDVALVARLRYVLSQSVKEGLVARPEEWPGASCVPWFFGKELAGTWISREHQTRARRRRGAVSPSTYTSRYEVPLSPLPCWRGLLREEIERLGRALLDDIVEEARAQRTGPPLGAEAAMKVDPHRPYKAPSTGPAPSCHASSASIRVAYKAVYRAFVAAFRAAAKAVKDGVTASLAQFPVGSSPRPGWFVTVPPGYVPPWMVRI